MPKIPPEAELLAAARQRGLLDKQGRIPVRERAKLAKEVQRANAKKPPTTASKLAEFANELRSEGLDGDTLLAELLGSAVRVLVAREGLVTNGDSEAATGSQGSSSAG
jgi:hypothetical protein